MRPGAIRWAWLALLAVLLTIAAGVGVDRWRVRAPAIDPATVRAGFGPASEAAARAQAERGVTEAHGSLKSGGDDWLHQEQLALALIARFRVTGDYADLAEAGRLLDQGLASAPDPAGPVFTKAMLAVLVHRLDAAETTLARIGRWAMPNSGELADAAAMAGDVALQRGQLDLAAAKFAEANRIAPGDGIALRIVMLDAQRGDIAKATRTLEAQIAEPRQQPGALADLMLQRATLAYRTGEWDEAGRWVGAAQRMLPGYWLADVYAAQQFALAGRTDEAARAYAIVARRTARPEVQDALAHLLRLEGRGAESRAWAAKAAAGWEARARLFPEAVIHHQAEHELAVGSAARALAFARADAAARPQAPNLVLLARALLVAGKPREALTALDKADAQGWVSAGQRMARAETLAALGDTAGSAAAKTKAESINPRAADPRARLIWFGHD